MPDRAGLVLSQPIGLKLRNSPEEDAIAAYQEVGLPEFIHSAELSKQQKIQTLRGIIMESGLTLYSELVANFLSRGCHFTGLSVDDYFQILLGNAIQPKLFADACSKAGTQLEYYFNDTSTERYFLVAQQERLKRISRFHKRFLILCKNYEVEFEQGLFDRFIQVSDLIMEITNPCMEGRYEEGYYGDLDRVLFEAVILGKPIDLVKIQCMRMLQTKDSDGRNRLSISTSIDYEEISDKGGRTRVFQDTSSLIDYLTHLSVKFADIGIEVRPIVVITDDDIRNMYPKGSVIPNADLIEIERKVLIYLQNLRQYTNKIGSSVEVYLISHLASGTGYEETKEYVCQDCIAGGKSERPIISEKEYGSAVQADQKKYGCELGYPIEISKYKVGMSFGVLRGLYDLGKQVEQVRQSNAVFIARSKPGIQMHMGVSVEGRSDRIPVLLAYSNGLKVFYERGRF
ncbi:hypothetical protein H6764_00360 [Candidatus Nomurabacteria bacterium]|nr:hypothetical protein [Candidatus Nomurabacteria bacterium]